MRIILLLAIVTLSGCDAFWVHSFATDPREVPKSDLKAFIAKYSEARGMPCTDAPFRGAERLRCVEPGWGGHQYVVFFSETADVAEAQLLLHTACCEPRWYREWRHELSTAAVERFGAKVRITAITGGGP
mgnify:CR=1 FL=1